MCVLSVQVMFGRVDQAGGIIGFETLSRSVFSRCWNSRSDDESTIQNQNQNNHAVRLRQRCQPRAPIRQPGKTNWPIGTPMPEAGWPTRLADEFWSCPKSTTYMSSGSANPQCVIETLLLNAKFFVLDETWRNARDRCACRLLAWDHACQQTLMYLQLHAN